MGQRGNIQHIETADDPNRTSEDGMGAIGKHMNLIGDVTKAREHCGEWESAGTKDDCGGDKRPGPE